MAIVSTIMIIPFPTALAGACVDNDGDLYWGNPECHHNLDPDDNDPCNPDPSAAACSPIEDIEDLIDDVEDLIDDEDDLELSDAQIHSILTKLENAIDKVASDNTKAAIGSLKAFINQINAFINAGSISSGDGQALIDGAESIIETLNAM